MVKRTFQPHKTRRKRRQGYLVKSRTKGGRKVLYRRRKKGRRRIGV